MEEKDFSKTEKKNNICVNVFGYEKKLEDSMDLLLLIDDNKWHYVYIKDFNRFVFHKKKKIKPKMVLYRCIYRK